MVGRLPSRPAVRNAPRAELLTFFSITRDFSFKGSLSRAASRRWGVGECHANVECRAASFDCSGGEQVGWLRSSRGKLPWFRGNSRVSELDSCQHSTNAPTGDPEGTTHSARTLSCVAAVAQEFLDVGHEIVGMELRSSAGVQMKQPFVGDFGVAEVLKARHLLSRPFVVKGQL